MKELITSRKVWLAVVLISLSALGGWWVFAQSRAERAQVLPTLTAAPLQAPNVTPVSTTATATRPPYPIATPLPLPSPTLTPLPPTPFIFRPTNTPVGYISPTSTPRPTGTPTWTATPTLSGTPTPINTTAWKVYENPLHGFRIRYPAHFTYFVISDKPGAESLYELIFYDGAKFQPGVTTQFPFIGISVLTNPQRLSTEAWVKDHVYRPDIPQQYSIQIGSYELVRTFDVRGIQATRITATSPANGIKGHNILIPFQDETKIISLFYYIDPPAIEPLFEVMASTLERTR